jgi:hypothetical protein
MEWWRAAGLASCRELLAGAAWKEERHVAALAALILITGSGT